MKKIITLALAAAMTIASAVVAFADEPIAAIDTTYTFENAQQNDTSVDKFANPFKNLGLDSATIQYTVTIPSNPKYLTGYDTVMTFGDKSSGFIYICNELVGMNNGGFVDYWPSGTTATMVYPGKGETYTVNLVFSGDGVAFYVNGEQMPGSNVSAGNADGTVGTLTGTDMLSFLNSESVLYIGANNTSYWAPQDMTLSNIVFFKGAVTTPYTVTGDEPKVGRIDENGEVQTEAPTQKSDNDNQQTVAPNIIVEEGGNMTVIMVIVVVVVVVVLGVAAAVILTQKRR